MRQLIIAALLAWAASAQTVVSPADITAAKKRLEQNPNGKPNSVGILGFGTAGMPPPEGADIIDLTVAR